MVTRASLIGAPDATSVIVPCTVAVCCARSGDATSIAPSATTAPKPALLIVNRMFRFPRCEVEVCAENQRTNGHPANAPGALESRATPEASANDYIDRE